MVILSSIKVGPVSLKKKHNGRQTINYVSNKSSSIIKIVFAPRPMSSYERQFLEQNVTQWTNKLFICFCMLTV